jgi:demethylspheroidene O-methyltransferase
MGFLPTGFVESWRDWRNRVIANPGFQLIAAKVPFLRPVANRRSQALFDIIAGFTYTQTLTACLELKLFSRLEPGPESLDVLADELAFAPHRLERLLKAAVSLDLLEARSEGRYALGIHGAAILGNPWIMGFIRHHPMLYRDLIDPTGVAYGHHETELSRYWAYSDGQDGTSAETAAVAPYSELMAASQRVVARDIMALYDFSTTQSLLDVGGGSGAFVEAVGRAYPAVSLTVFALPALAPLATDRFHKAGLSARARFVPGSFLTDSLPQGADTITLIRVLHDHDDESALRILTAIRACLPQHGCLVLAEPMAGNPKLARIMDAYFGLYFAAMGQGKTRTPQEIGVLAQKAGFRVICLARTKMPLITSLMVLRP